MSATKFTAPPPPRREPPAPAEVLFDGKDLEKWDWWFGGKEGAAVFGLDGRAHSGEGLPEFNGARWPVVDGQAVAALSWGDLVTRKEFTDYRLHLDFLIPPLPADVQGIWRGNSGVYLNSRYEIQILDSKAQGVDPRQRCGAILGQQAPSRDAAREAGQWQSLDVVFRAARFRAGQKTNPARATVLLNGEEIHRNVVLESETPWGLPEEGQNGPLAGPLRLQSDS